MKPKISAKKRNNFWAKDRRENFEPITVDYVLIPNAIVFSWSTTFIQKIKKWTTFEKKDVSFGVCFGTSCCDF